MSYNVHVTLFISSRNEEWMVGVLSEKAAKPVTTVQDGVSIFLSVKPTKSFIEVLGKFWRQWIQFFDGSSRRLQPCLWRSKRHILKTDNAKKHKAATWINVKYEHISGLQKHTLPILILVIRLFYKLICISGFILGMRSVDPRIKGGLRFIDETGCCISMRSDTFKALLFKSTNFKTSGNSERRTQRGQKCVFSKI